MNPDVLTFPNSLSELLIAHSRPGVGLVEARQIPVEHPKEYDPITGETSWASGACLLGETQLFRKLEGFDNESFFHFCDDVDISWRARLAGYKVIHAPLAEVYHDRVLNKNGQLEAGRFAEYSSAEFALFLSYKYSRTDITDRLLKKFQASDNPVQIEAAQHFLSRKKEGRLPSQIDRDFRVGQFIDGNYARHRYAT